MIATLLSSHSNARGPDFSQLTKHSFELSSTGLSVQLPGRLDKEFPVKPGLYRVNIYSNEKYNDSNHYDKILLERYWDYRGFFWQGQGGQYALLSLLITLSKVPESNSVNLLKDGSQLQSIIRKSIQDEYDQENQDIATDSNTANMKIEVQIDFKPLEYNGIKVLESIIKDNHPLGGGREYTHFYIPISEQHYLTFIFKTTPVGNKKKHLDKWYQQSQNDIQRIMESLIINYPTVSP